MHYLLHLLRFFFYQISYFSLLICTAFFVACKDKNSPSKEVNDVSKRKYYQINLFAEDKVEESNTSITQLTFQEASDLSECVLLAPTVQKVDSAIGRGVKSFYLYKVNEVHFIKPLKSKGSKDALYFISKENLFKGQIHKDSVYLFLAPLVNYNILKSQTGIKYTWVDNAPFSKEK